MTLSKDGASEDTDPSSIGAAAARSSTVHVVDSTAGEFSQAHAASLIDPASVNVEPAPSSSKTPSLHLPPPGMLSGNNGVQIVANYQDQQHQQKMHVQQVQYMPPTHMPKSKVMPPPSTTSVQQCTLGDHPAYPSFAAMAAPAQASPAFGIGLMLSGGAYLMPQVGHPRASSNPSVSFAAFHVFYSCILLAACFTF